MTAATTESNQQNRLNVFGIGQQDIAVLQSNSEFAEHRLPTLLEQWHTLFEVDPVGETAEVAG